MQRLLKCQFLMNLQNMLKEKIQKKKRLLKFYDITIRGYVGIGVEDGYTIDLNGKKLNINNSLVAIMYGASNDGTTFYNSATLTFKDSSRGKQGFVDNIQTFIIFNGRKDIFDFIVPNEADQDYKLIIDGRHLSKHYYLIIVWLHLIVCFHYWKQVMKHGTIM